MRRYLIFTPVDSIYEHQQPIIALRQHLSRHVPDCRFVLAYQDASKDIPRRHLDRFTACPMKRTAQQGTGANARSVEIKAEPQDFPTSILLKRWTSSILASAGLNCIRSRAAEAAKECNSLYFRGQTRITQLSKLQRNVSQVVLKPCGHRLFLGQVLLKDTDGFVEATGFGQDDQ
jgi:hypothetical protein